MDKQRSQEFKGGHQILALRTRKKLNKGACSWGISKSLTDREGNSRVSKEWRPRHQSIMCSENNSLM